MRVKNTKSGFTLLEIIIVIIIIGVLASLALPRLFSTVNYSKSTEALNAIGMIRQAVERCALQQGGAYTATCEAFANLDMTDPSNAAGLVAGSHFDYTISVTGNPQTFTATGANFDGITAADTIVISVDNVAVPPTVTRSGTGVFASLQ